jgi:DNA sulfur modification protein DndD
MRFRSLELHNFRGFLGTHSIEFASDDKENLTLILAENEVGKSTLLNAFVWCFYGRMTSDTDRAHELVHDEAKDRKSHVQIQIEENGQVYLFKRGTDGNKSFFRSWEEDDIGTLKPIYIPDSLIKTFLPPALSDYFLFNGEGLKEIIKDPHTLKTSIRDIQGLTAAEAALESIKKHKISLQAESNRTNAKDKVLKIKKADLKNKINDLKPLEESLAKAKLDHEKACTDFQNAKDLWDAVKSFDAKSLKKAETESLGRFKKLSEDIKDLGDERKSFIAKYGIDIMGFPFSSSANEHLIGAKEKGYPSKYHKQIIQDSISEDECKLCERDFEKDGSTKNLLQTKIALAIDDDLSERIDKARASISSVESSIKLFNSDLETAETKLEKKLQDKIEEKNILDSIQAKLSALAGKDKEVKAAESKFNTCNSKQLSTAAKIGTVKANMESLNYDKDKLSGEILRAEIEINPTSTLLNEIYFLDECIKDLEDLMIEQEKSGRDFIFNDMNESLKKHSKGNHQFGFEKDEHGEITYNPVILKSDGKTPVKLSTGAKKLKKNLFFITSLIKHSRMRANSSGTIQIPGTIAPLVVDAPFSDLDEFNIKIAARVLLESSDQLIVMISSSSFNGGFLDVLNEDKGFIDRLGRAYVLKKHFKGPKGGKPSLEINAFKTKIATAIYDSKNETSEIEEISFGG